VMVAYLLEVRRAGSSESQAAAASAVGSSGRSSSA
jgi:hypothetical protein